MSRATALLALLLAPGGLGAQAVTGRMVDADTGQPLAGAAVHLLDGASAELASVLTDEDGRYRVRAPAPGRYRIRADRIGFASTHAGPVDLGAGQTATVDLKGSVEAISLRGILVSGERRCTLRPEEGERTATVWQEARKALRAVSLTSVSGEYQFGLVVYERELDSSTLRVMSEKRHARQSRGDYTFVSLPADDLLRRGFVRVDDGMFTYFAPDANVLLSDLFLDTHCFRLVPGRDEWQGRVGLEFEPVPGRRVTDIRGTLWLDPGTGELRHLEYSYTRLPIETNLAGGEVAFERLPEGPWIVRRWRIRMPRAGVERAWWDGPAGRDRIVVAAVTEAAGEVVRISRRGERVVESRNAVVAGVVYDSTANAPLAGADVFIDGTQYRAATDEEGAFRIEDVPPGRYAINFFHPRMERLGTYPGARTLEVADRTAEPVDLYLSCSGTRPGSRCRQVVARADAAAEGEEPDPADVIPLAPVRVEAEADRAADGRAAATRVDYLARAEIERWLPAVSMANLLRSARFSGLTIRQRRPSAGASVTALCIESRRASNSRFHTCNTVTVYLDGTRIADPGMVIESIDPNDIDSIEYIPPIRAQARYGREGANGVLRINTLRR